MLQLKFQTLRQLWRANFASIYFLNVCFNNMSYLGYLPNTMTIIRKKLLPKIVIYNPKTQNFNIYKWNSFSQIFTKTNILFVDIFYISYWYFIDIAANNRQGINLYILYLSYQN